MDIWQPLLDFLIDSMKIRQPLLDFLIDSMKIWQPLLDFLIGSLKIWQPLFEFLSFQRVFDHICGQVILATPFFDPKPCFRGVASVAAANFSVYLLLYKNIIYTILQFSKIGIENSTQTSQKL